MINTTNITNITNSTYNTEEITPMQIFYLFLLVVGSYTPVCICIICCRIFDKIEKNRINNYKELYHISESDESEISVSSDISISPVPELTSGIEAPEDDDRS